MDENNDVLGAVIAEMREHRTCPATEADVARWATALDEVAAEVRIEPLHDPRCPYQPDDPTDADCTCTHLAQRWKVRAILERRRANGYEAEVARLREDKLAPVWRERAEQAE